MKSQTFQRLFFSSLLVLPLGCISEAPSQDEGTGESSDGALPGTGAASTGVDAETTTDSDPGETSTTTEGGGTGVACPEDGKIYACADGEDNDGDGKIDAADPECTGPCDDDEKSFQTGLPGDNVDCWQDCFFDGNSGQGGGDCRWNLKCDPANPGANIGCEYDPDSNACMNMPADTPDTCLEQCLPNVPNGCDCFGCCEVYTSEGPVFVFLGSSEDCSVDNIEACETCTWNEDCGNPCEPEECEICIGDYILPEDCEEAGCPEGSIPCDDDGDPDTPSCPDNMYCLTGCCVDYTPVD